MAVATETATTTAGGGGNTTTVAAEGSLTKRLGGTPSCCLVRTTDNLATMVVGEESRTW